MSEEHNVPAPPPLGVSEEETEEESFRCTNALGKRALPVHLSDATSEGATLGSSKKARTQAGLAFPATRIRECLERGGYATEVS